MNKKLSVWFCSGLFAVGLLTAPQEVQADLNNGVTQGELAEILVVLTGLGADLPPNFTHLEAIAALTAAGISPLGGWNADRPVVLGDLAVVLVRALGVEGSVEDPTDPASYIALLIELGAPLETVGSAVTIVAPGGDAVRQSPNTGLGLGGPGPGGIAQRLVLGQDMTQIIAALPSIPVRPRPVTPD